MNAKLYSGVIDAIRWMREHLQEHPDLLPILTRLRDGERAERTDAKDTSTAITRIMGATMETGTKTLADLLVEATAIWQSNIARRVKEDRECEALHQRMHEEAAAKAKALFGPVPFKTQQSPGACRESWHYTFEAIAIEMAPVSVHMKGEIARGWPEENTEPEICITVHGGDNVYSTFDAWYFNGKSDVDGSSRMNFRTLPEAMARAMEAFQSYRQAHEAKAKFESRPKVKAEVVPSAGDLLLQAITNFVQEVVPAQE